MIQRIQSLFYLLASGSLFSLFGLPFATSPKAMSPFFEDMAYSIMDHPVLMGLTIAGGSIALLNIFLFKKRGIQLRLGILVIICSLLLAFVAGYLVYQEGGAMNPNVDPQEGLGVGAPFLALIFGIIGNYFTKKDEKLVRSMDRLR